MSQTLTITRYPYTRTVKSPAKVVQFLDGSEQRWRSGPVLNDFVLQLNGVPFADVSTVASWFTTVKGAYRTDTDLSVRGETFTGMAAESDELEISESSPNLFSVAVRLRQTAPSGSWPAADPIFPALSTGRITQLPSSSGSRFLTARNDLEGGARFAWYERANARTFWKLSFPAITPAELLTLLQFFVARGSRYEEFTLTDPGDDAVTYEHCYFRSDELTAQYVNAGECSCSLEIEQLAS